MKPKAPILSLYFILLCLASPKPPLAHGTEPSGLDDSLYSPSSIERAHLLESQFPPEEQTILVKGTVTSNGSGETIPGVNIIIKGTSIGTITDVYGTYEIDVPEDAVLISPRLGTLLLRCPSTVAP